MTKVKFSSLIPGHLRSELVNLGCTIQDTELPYYIEIPQHKDVEVIDKIQRQMEYWFVDYPDNGKDAERTRSMYGPKEIAEKLGYTCKVEASSDGNPKVTCHRN